MALLKVVGDLQRLGMKRSLCLNHLAEVTYVFRLVENPRHFSIVLSSDRPQSKMETMIFWPKVPGDGDEVSRGKISQDTNPIDEQLGHPMGQALYYWPTFLQERINS